MTERFNAPWHRLSWDRFIKEELPHFLSQRLPLMGVLTEVLDAHRFNLKIVLHGVDGEIEVVYKDLPQPNAEGVFLIEGREYVVPPLAEHEQLDSAQVLCVGEQLEEFVKERLGEVSQGWEWDAELAQRWFPFARWMEAFLATRGQPLQQTNWLDRNTHLRRVIIPHRDDVIAAGQFGRTCPFETPEGPNIGHVLTIALGADIREGRLVQAGEDPVEWLGRGASMVPFLEHDDGNRLLMGINMMRQWVPLAQPEAAWVQTGNEPAVEGFWNGRNLLTAYISWDGAAFEDGIVLSATAAQKLTDTQAAELGDKLSNRHGIKGVVSQIVADDQMPRLADGTPVELIYSVCGVPSRMALGQLREAALGRVAAKAGEPARVPPFGGPTDDELRALLRQAGLAEDGMEQLDGLARRSTVGPVYWGRTNHNARAKIHWAVDPQGQPQIQGEAEYVLLQENGAVENIAEHFNTRSSERPDAASLAERVAAGPVDQAPPPTPGFAALVRRLALAGIAAELQDGAIHFSAVSCQEPALRLAQALPHPWGRAPIDTVGACPGMPEYEALKAANARLERMLESKAPPSLMGRTLEQLKVHLKAYCDVILTPEHLHFNTTVLFSGRTVVTPGPDLRYDQVGVPEEMAWALFGPLVCRQLDADQVKKRSAKAAKKLDEIMAAAWLVVYRPPAYAFTAVTAFRPQRCAGNALRLHPFTCDLLNTDFDGDQIAIFLPLTEAGQKEAGQRLSIQAHIQREPARMVGPAHDAMAGLAVLSRQQGGHQEIERLAGVAVDSWEGMVTRQTVQAALKQLLAEKGAGVALDAADALMRRGFAEAKRTGLSISPFIGATLDLPQVPDTDDPDQWVAHRGECVALIANHRGFDDDEFGSVNLLSKCGARGNAEQLVQLVGPHGFSYDMQGQVVPLRHGWRQGLTPAEHFARLPGARRGLAAVNAEVAQELESSQRSAPAGYGVLARARRAQHPGAVFARAATTHEVDVLSDAYSKVFVGLPAK